MTEPTTTWREVIAPDEAARFAAYAEALVAAAGGGGRALHRKQVLGLDAALEIPAELPAHARHGLFARPGRHPARIRLSNGSPARGPDRRPDVRGFAVRVDGVTGEGALGAATTAQCFLFIPPPTFAFATVDEFMGVARAAGRGQLAVLRYLIGRHGLRRGLAAARKLGKGLARPFAGFARETFHSAAPVACGPYAAKVRLTPTGPDRGPRPTRDDWAADVAARLAAGPLTWDLQLQFYVDDATTPIEDPTVEWTTPFVTVAQLTAPAQDARDPTRAAAIEAAVFDPWQALADHRPLGEIMRARKVAYHASQRARGAA